MYTELIFAYYTVIEKKMQIAKLKKRKKKEEKSDDLQHYFLIRIYMQTAF